MAKASTTTKRTTKKTAARAGRKPPPEGETRREKFERICTRRMNDVLQKIRLLGNLSGQQYECNEGDTSVMRDAIEAAMVEAFARFAPRQQTARRPTFTLHGQQDGKTSH